MSYADFQTALDAHAQFNENPTDPGEHYQLLSAAAAIDGLRALEDSQCNDESMSLGAARSSLPAIVAEEVERQLEMKGLDIPLEQRKDLFEHATGQALHLFDNPHSW